MFESDFHAAAVRFAKDGLVGDPQTPVGNYLWVGTNANGTEMIKAFQVSASIDVHASGTVEEALRQKELWTAHIANFNKHASKYAAGAWHTSSLWVRAEAQEQLV